MFCRHQRTVIRSLSASRPPRTLHHSRRICIVTHTPSWSGLTQHPTSPPLPWLPGSPTSCPLLVVDNQGTCLLVEGALLKRRTGMYTRKYQAAYSFRFYGATPPPSSREVLQWLYTIGGRGGTPDPPPPPPLLMCNCTWKMCGAFGHFGHFGGPQPPRGGGSEKSDSVGGFGTPPPFFKMVCGGV